MSGTAVHVGCLLLGKVEAKSHDVLIVSEELHLLESSALAFMTDSVWSRFACDLTHQQFSVASAEAKICLFFQLA